MAKTNVNTEGKGAITYWISETEQITVTSDMSPEQVAALQSDYWAKIANVPARRLSSVELPGEAAKHAVTVADSTRFKDKAFLRFK